jgi:hypothetical protein
MKKHLLLAVTASFLVAGSTTTFIACSGDDNSTTPGGDAGQTGDSGNNTPGDSGNNNPGDAGPGTDSGNQNPPVPTLGAQIDRMGRPAINTALNHGFDSDTTTSGPAKDSYNADKSTTTWAATYSPQFEGNLAILDSLNTGASADGGGGCGDQPYVDNTMDSGAAYGTLAGVLANDMLWLKTNAAACTTGYLAVELNATNVVANTDCGGRTLTYDTIMTTYSVTSGVGLTGFGSGVSAVTAKTNGTTFPYLSTPL